jgi:hypothetical protein
MRRGPSGKQIGYHYLTDNSICSQTIGLFCGSTCGSSSKSYVLLTSSSDGGLLFLRRKVLSPLTKYSYKSCLNFHFSIFLLLKREWNPLLKCILFYL